MKMLSILDRVRLRRGATEARANPIHTMTTRDWADLPTYHPGKI